jgi:hypothetical protein
MATAFVALGWVATLVYIAAQAYISWVQGYKPQLYYKLNALGAAGFIVSSAAIASWQSVAVNVFWLLVSVLSLSQTRILKRARLSRWWVLAPLFLFCLVSLFWLTKDRQLSFAMLGWAGSLLYCASYGLFAYHVIGRMRFLGYNCAAAVFLLPVYTLQTNWPAFALSVIWAIISASGCVAIARSRARG